MQPQRQAPRLSVARLSYQSSSRRSASLPTPLHIFFTSSTFLYAHAHKRQKYVASGSKTCGVVAYSILVRSKFSRRVSFSLSLLSPSYLALASGRLESLGHRMFRGLSCLLSAPPPLFLLAAAYRFSPAVASFQDFL